MMNFFLITSVFFICVICILSIFFANRFFVADGIKSKIAILLVDLIIVIATVYIIISIDNFLGYPIDEKIDNEIKIISFVPDFKRDKIYIWKYDTEKGLPRAIAIPYSKEDHEKLEKARKQTPKGSTMLFLKEGAKINLNSKNTSLQEMRFQIVNPALNDLKNTR